MLKHVLLVLPLLVLLGFAALHPEEAEAKKPWPAQIYEPELPRIQIQSEGSLRLYRQDSSASYRRKLQETYPKWHVSEAQAMVTAYCPCKICCGSQARGVTASGAKTKDRPYGLAVPRELLHSRIHVPGYLSETAPMVFWKADDTGSALEENWAKTPRVLHIDVRFKNHDWARQWGVRYMTVYFLTKP